MTPKSCTPKSTKPMKTTADAVMSHHKKNKPGNGKDLIFIDPKYYRPTEVDVLWGDASKAARVLGWRPRTSFRQLIAEMVQQDTQTVCTII